MKLIKKKVSDLKDHPLNEKTRVVIINSPSNPTGGVMPKEDLDKVMALCEKFPKCWVVSDEIYSQLTYDSMGTPPSALNCAPDPRPSRPSRCCVRCGSPCAGALARPVDAPARHRGRRLQQARFPADEWDAGTATEASWVELCLLRGAIC